MNKYIILSTFLYSITMFSMESSEQSVKKEPFIRIVDRGDKKSLQLASKTYINHSQNLRVTLLSAMHYAEESFYQRQMEIACGASFVLYEGKGLDKNGIEWQSQPLPSQIARSESYSIIAKAYNLSLQLEKINYTYPNFIHADFSFQEECQNPEETLSNFMDFIEYSNNKHRDDAKRVGLDSGYEYFINDLVNKQKQTDFKSILELLVTPIDNIELIIKQNGEEVYIKEFVTRNVIVLNKFEDLVTGMSQINPKHIIIFYGAGHMPYFETQLCEKYRLQFQSEEWIPALSY